MRPISHCVLLVLVLLPFRGAAGLTYSVKGNADQAAANYSHWSGLVEFVNQPTRRMIVWGNGAESISYRGETEQLNEALQLFSEIDSKTHHVVLRPAVANNKYDWQLKIVQGIARAMVQQQGLGSLRRLDPTLVIYVSDRIDLQSLAVPDNVELYQLSDLRERYANVAQTGSENAKRESARYLLALDEEPGRSGLSKTEYDARIQSIQRFIQSRR